MLETSSSPIYTVHDLYELTDQAHQHHLRVTLVTGVFDILHQEHLIFLTKARAVGDILVVGVESDVRVTAMKGLGRPYHPLAERLANLAQLGVATAVFGLPESFNTPQEREALIARIKPSVLAVSSHTAHQEAKQALVNKYGGQLVIVHQHNPAVSTSLLLEQMAK